MVPYSSRVYDMDWNIWQSCWISCHICSVLWTSVESMKRGGERVLLVWWVWEERWGTEKPWTRKVVVVVAEDHQREKPKYEVMWSNWRIDRQLHGASQLQLGLLIQYAEMRH